MSTFYRKYRPKKFSEVIGQTSVVQTIENSLTRDQVAHAYLLTGPRGTGKTTLARLFAQAINCERRKGAEPCGKCLPCTLQNEGRTLDVIEIDAASHTGVDNIRELRETISLAPTVASHKVYIIDEAHMLSLGAWNALLKTLEEPPAHVVFILATTRVDKVPETILSRAIRFDLVRFPIDDIEKKLERIARAEKIEIDRGALGLIARAAAGGMRDAEVIFTQIATLEESPIDRKRVALLLGLSGEGTLDPILQAIADNDLPTALAHLRKLRASGLDMSRLTENLLEYVRRLLFFALDESAAMKTETGLLAEERARLATLANSLGSERIITILEHFQEAYNRIKDTPIPELPLEIALAKLIVNPEKKNSSRAPKDPSGPPPTTPSDSPPSSTVRPPTHAPLAPKKSVAPTKIKIPTSGPHPPIDFDAVRERWASIVDLAKTINASVAVALATATPHQVEKNTLVLGVRYPFHKERLLDSTSRLTLDRAFDTILGFRPAWSVAIIGKEDPGLSTSSAPPLIDQAIDILGGKLVQENS